MLIIQKKTGKGLAIADEFTELLIHSDDTNGSTNIVDSSILNRTITNSGAKHDTISVPPVFGQSSIAISGYYNFSDYFSASTRSSWGANDFTVDFWFRPSAPFNRWSENFYVFSVEYSSIDLRLTWRRPNTNTWQLSVNYIDNSFIVGITSGWNHVAIVRYGTDLLFFLDGIYKNGLLAYRDDPILSSAWSWGHLGGNNGGDCWLDEIHISSTARWITDFTPPTVPYSY
jgi:hypothetical protein